MEAKQNRHYNKSRVRRVLMEANSTRLAHLAVRRIKIAFDLMDSMTA